MHFALVISVLIGALVVGIESQNPISVCSSCPSNEAFKHNGFYYQFFDCPVTWAQANATCQNGMTINGKKIPGGFLVSILDADEQNWLAFQIDMRYGANVGIWIGIKRAPHPPKSCPDSFQWTDGNKVVYKNFKKGEPNCVWEGEDCLHLIDSYHWNDAECQLQFRFVCKMKPSHPSAFDIQ